MIEEGVDVSRLQSLIEDKALAQDTMDTSGVAKVREEMERAQARRLQPHYIKSFFLEAFRQLGGTMRRREKSRLEITNVPSTIRNRDRLIGRGDPVLTRYERVTFEKEDVNLPGQPLAAFICPGHPLMDSVVDLTLERHRNLLKRGTVLVDEQDDGTNPRVLFFLEHSIKDASLVASGDNRTISRRMLYVEMDSTGGTRHLHYAPYLDYRPLKEDEPGIDQILARPECKWITRELEQKARGHAISRVVPLHVQEVTSRRIELIEKTRAAVKDRLTKEIAYWDHKAEQLKLQEKAGKKGAKLNSHEARRRADDLQGRLEKRLQELDRESHITASPPVVMGGLVVVPMGLINLVAGRQEKKPSGSQVDNLAVAARARSIVMDIERGLGYEPRDVELEKLGYDIESRGADNGRLRFIEVKGRAAGSQTVTVTRNEILYSLNNPDNFILALVEFQDLERYRVRYVRTPFTSEPDFGANSVNYDFGQLLDKSTEPC